MRLLFISTASNIFFSVDDDYNTRTLYFGLIPVIELWTECERKTVSTIVKKYVRSPSWVPQIYLDTDIDHDQDIMRPILFCMDDVLIRHIPANFLLRFYLIISRVIYFKTYKNFLLPFNFLCIAYFVNYVSALFFMRNIFLYYQSSESMYIFFIQCV